MLPIGMLLATLQKPVTLVPGTRLTKSVRIAPGVYRLPSRADLSRPALVVEGNNLTLDFSGVILEGTDQRLDPDKRVGLGVEVRGANVTIKNLKVRGYKVGLIARNVRGLRILSSDFSYNWKQRLLSTLDQEDGADWMSYHRNEKDEWLRYGAGIYLRKCDSFEVAGTTIRGGANGLMLMECNKGKVWNNDFSFLSAIGLGMYQSSDNRVMHNNIDWCVRGYSHGRWNRGQDSAGILIYEQSNRNIFAYNSVTHGGDGFFLWAGQTTMDTGKGGCNDNQLVGNDFSHAPTNGIEATFSRNAIINNKIFECWHGVWGGYSFDTMIEGNLFGHNAESIAIEHGQSNAIKGNAFRRELNGLVIWMNPTQDPNWGYPKNRDTRSMGYIVQNNLFADFNGTALSVRDTTDFSVRDNQFARTSQPLQLRGENPGFTFVQNRVSGLTKGTIPEGNLVTKDAAVPAPSTMQPSGNVILGLDPDNADYLRRFDTPNWNPIISSSQVPPMRGGKIPFLASGTLRGRRYILVDQWGPYDFKSPILWPRQWRADGSLITGNEERFEILGPKGTWRLKSKVGVESVSASSGQVPGWITIKTPVGKPGQTKLELEYIGEATTDVSGIVTPKGKPVRFGFEKFSTAIDWDVKFFKWGPESDPRTKPEAFAAIVAGEPILRRKLSALAYGGAFEPSLPSDHFATDAEGTFEVPAGTYVLDFTTDDGLRVWLDGKPLVEDAWKYQGPTVYSREVKLGGKHRIRLQHFQIDGYATLQVRIRRK
ncbi:MAG: right-handed parallel beta-helix repeat-containing protein [Fimbriimonas sp.]